MSERPILFSGPMVRAILDGRKTQTRRIVTHRHGINFLGGAGQKDDPECWGWSFDGPDHSGYMVIARGLNERGDNGCVSMPCPYGEPGDLLWVRETWGMSYVDIAGDRPHIAAGHWGSPSHPNRECAVVFRSDGVAMPDDSPRETARWRSPLFMPRWASRISLRVTDVRVQRLQEISEEDARAEGCKADDAFVLYQAGLDGTLQTSEMPSTARGAFAAIWDSINAKRAAWASNPWVWAISFERTS